MEVNSRLIHVGGKPAGVQGIARDITDRKRTEDQLRKLSCAVEQSATSVVITDVRGNIEYVNPRFTELTGYTMEEALGKNPRILKSGEHSAEMYKQLWRTVTSGGKWTGEFHNKKRNGDLYWESAVISPIRNAEGVTTHFLAVKEDITERKRAEETLSQERNLLRTVFDNLPGYAGVKDTESRIIICNTGLAHLLGAAKAEELLGKTDFDFFPHEVAENYRSSRTRDHSIRPGPGRRRKNCRG